MYLPGSKIRRPTRPPPPPPPKREVESESESENESKNETKNESESKSERSQSESENESSDEIESISDSDSNSDLDRETEHYRQNSGIIYRDDHLTDYPHSQMSMGMKNIPKISETSFEMTLERSRERSIIQPNINNDPDKCYEENLVRIANIFPCPSYPGEEILHLLPWYTEIRHEQIYNTYTLYCNVCYKNCTAEHLYSKKHKSSFTNWSAIMNMPYNIKQVFVENSFKFVNPAENYRRFTEQFQPLQIAHEEPKKLLAPKNYSQQSQQNLAKNNMQLAEIDPRMDPKDPRIDPDMRAKDDYIAFLTQKYG